MGVPESPFILLQNSVGMAWPLEQQTALDRGHLEEALAPPEEAGPWTWERWVGERGVLPRQRCNFGASGDAVGVSDDWEGDRSEGGFGGQ